MQKKISVNGEVENLSAKSIKLLLENRGINCSNGGIAVARNGQVVPRTNWGQDFLKANDKIEIVHIVRGG